MRPAAEQAPGRDVGLRPHRSPQFNLMFETRVGALEETGLPVYLRPETTQGSSSIQERRRDSGTRAAVRDRPGRQVLPERDNARRLHLPHARVRADGDGVLRAAGRGRRVVPLLGRRAVRMASPLRHSREPPADSPARGRRAVPLLERHERPRVPLPYRLVSSKESRTGARSISCAYERLGDEARVGRAGRQPVHAARDRAGPRGQPLDVRIPRRRLRRGGRCGARSHRASPAPAARPGQGRRAAPDRKERGHDGGARKLTRSCAR